MTFGPLGDGNYQFSAIGHQLYRLSIYWSASKVREEIAEYLEENQNDQQDMLLESQYLQEMATDETYGDGLTLCTASNI